jgi:O-methyltransferase involved in polyketide biosynthesis
VVLTHAQALLTSSPEDATDYLQADLRDTDTILAGAARTLDFTRPVAILLIGVLHFIQDAEDPYAVVARLMEAIPPGSYLVMAHAASDIATEASAETARRYNQMSPVLITPRNREQVARFFDGLDLVRPGVVPIGQWSLADPIDPAIGGMVGYCGIGRKP